MTDGSTDTSSSSSPTRARCSARKVRHNGPFSRWAFPQMCQLTCSSGPSARPPRSRTILASLARANQGVSCHANSAQTGPATGAASSRSQPFRQPGPMLASRISASTRSGARLAADSATPPP